MKYLSPIISFNHHGYSPSNIQQLTKNSFINLIPFRLLFHFLAESNDFMHKARLASLSLSPILDRTLLAML